MKSKNKKKLFGIRIDVENVKMLDELAQRTKISRNSLINIILHAVKDRDLTKIEKILSI